MTIDRDDQLKNLTLCIWQKKKCKIVTLYGLTIDRDDQVKNLTLCIWQKKM